MTEHHNDSALNFGISKSCDIWNSLHKLAYLILNWCSCFVVLSWLCQLNLSQPTWNLFVREYGWCKAHQPSFAVVVDLQAMQRELQKQRQLDWEHQRRDQLIVLKARCQNVQDQVEKDIARLKKDCVTGVSLLYFTVCIKSHSLEVFLINEVPNSSLKMTTVLSVICICIF